MQALRALIKRIRIRLHSWRMDRGYRKGTIKRGRTDTQ